jgi:hypothetical protein
MYVVESTMPTGLMGRVIESRRVGVIGSITKKSKWHMPNVTGLNPFKLNFGLLQFFGFFLCMCVQIFKYTFIVSNT